MEAVKHFDYKDLRYISQGWAQFPLTEELGVKAEKKVIPLSGGTFVSPIAINPNELVSKKKKKRGVQEAHIHVSHYNKRKLHADTIRYVPLDSVVSYNTVEAIKEYASLVEEYHRTTALNLIKDGDCTQELELALFPSFVQQPVIAETLMVLFHKLKARASHKKEGVDASFKQAIINCWPLLRHLEEGMDEEEIASHVEKIAMLEGSINFLVNPFNVRYEPFDMKEVDYGLSAVLGDA